MQAIISNRGDESEAGAVAKGETIATMISGASPCSTGTHLHLEILKDGGHINPAELLAAKDVVWRNQPDSPFSFTGSWDWPLSGQVDITQGYGMTAFARSGYYGGNPHHGLDMVSGDKNIHSLSEGKVYNGSIACGGGKLRYVKVEHKDTGHISYYLHINYIKG